MSSFDPSPEALLSEIATLRLRLEEAEDTLAAIQGGAVDALVIGGRVFTLEGAERPYHELVDRMTEGAAFLNRDGVILYANRYLADLLDTPLASLTGAPWLDQVAPHEQARVADWLARPTPSQSPLDISLVTPGGESRPALLAMAELSLAGQTGYAVLVTDLRARKAAEVKILRLNRLYAMASAVNACIARQPERATLFQEFCRIAVNLGGHRLAWIGVPDSASGVLAVVAAAGATGYLEGVEVSIRDVPAGRGPSSIAFREGRCTVVNDFQQAEQTRPWHDQARAFDLRASASVPFHEQGAVSGVFNLYAAETGCFSDEDLALLEQMGDDLTFALEQAAQAERLREAERQILINAERERAAAAMLEQARLLAETQRIARVGSWRYDFHDPILWSAETYRIFGVDPATFTPSIENLSALLHADDRLALRNWLTACAAGDSPGEVLLRRVLPDGSLRYLVGQGQRLVDAAGQPIGMAGTVQDITQRREMELRTLANEERLRLALTAAMLGIFDWDFVQDRVVWSARTEQLFGYRSGEFDGTYAGFAKRLHPADRDRVENEVALCRDEARPYACEYRVVWPDGKVVWIEAHGEFTYDDDGRPARMRGTVADITHRKHTEETLHAQRELLDKIMDSTPSSVFAMDREHRFILTNRAHLQFWSLTESEMLGHTELELFPPQTADRLWADNERIMRERLPLQLEEDLLLPSGRQATVITSKFPLLAMNGEIMGLGGVATDITAVRQTEAAYRISQEQLQQALEASAMGAFEWSITENTARWSRQHELIWGYGPGEFGGHYAEFASRVHPDDLAALEADLARCQAEQKRLYHEFRVVWPNGEVHWVVGRGQFSYDSEGQPQTMHGTVIDITLQKRAIQAQQDLALLEATARYTRSLIETSLDPLVTISANGLITDVNAATEAATGLPREALIGTEFTAYFTDPAAAREGYRQAFGTGAVRDYPLGLRHRDGRVIPVLYNAAVYRNAEGEVAGLFAAARDITAQQAAEAALQESEARFRLLANAAPALIWMTGPDQGLTWCNDQWLAFSGRTLAEETGNGWLEGMHPDDREQCLAKLKDCFDAREPLELEYRMRRHDGEYRWLLDQGVPLFEAEGQFSGYIGACIDITPAKTLTFELERATHALAAQTARLETILATISDGLHIVDAQGRLVECNASFARMLGYTPAEMAQMRVADWEGAISATEQPERLQALVTHPARFETRHRRKDGTLFDVEISSNPLELAGMPYFIGAARDISERKQAEQELLRQGLLINLAHDAILIRQMSGVIEYWNQGAEFTYGWPSSAALGQVIHKFLATKFPESQAELEASLATTGRWEGELTHRRRNGAVVIVASRQVLFRGSTAADDRVLEINRDITAEKAAESSLRLAARVFAGAREGIVITDAEARIVEVNAAFTYITGYAREEALGQNPRLLKSGRHDAAFWAALWQSLNSKGQWYGEIWNQRKNGEIFCEMVTMSVLRNSEGKIEHYLAMFSDITFMKEHQQQLEHIAHFDALTLLPNRLLLADRLDQAIAQADRHGSVLAVAYLDLDGFKTINDTHGHAAGDSLLQALAQRMRSVLREVDTLARIGGDEFIAVLGDLGRPEDCQPLLERLLRAAAAPVTVGQLTLQVSASIGVTTYPGTMPGVNPGQLLRQADQAMYQAKQAGKNCWHRFDMRRDAELKTALALLEEVSQAIAREEFVLYYQPKVNLKTGAVIGAEALLRWRHPERGLLPPAAFLTAIEHHEFGITLGEWVIDAAFAQLAEWHGQGFTLPISVNITASHLQHEDFVSRLGARFAHHPELPPSLLELEVLESSALEDLNNATAIMRACNALGVRFALDDFGTGYASLTYLRRLPVDLIKIDRSFVIDMLTDPVDLAIVTSVIALARAFQYPVIAEGVETRAHGERLLALDCDLAQGYAIARPMPGSGLPGWVSAWQPPMWP